MKGLLVIGLLMAGFLIVNLPLPADVLEARTQYEAARLEVTRTAREIDRIQAQLIEQQVQQAEVRRTADHQHLNYFRATILVPFIYMVSVVLLLLVLFTGLYIIWCVRLELRKRQLQAMLAQQNQPAGPRVVPPRPPSLPEIG